MATLKGTWVFNDSPVVTNISWRNQTINFVSDGVIYVGFSTYENSVYNECELLYNYPAGNFASSKSVYTYYVSDSYGLWFLTNGFEQKALKTVSFGEAEQEVSDDFYEWFTANAVEQASEEETPIGKIKIFTKLNTSDVVASSGTKVFKKLTKALPAWSGMDLTGTTWRISNSGWTAEAGYGEFAVQGSYYNKKPYYGTSYYIVKLSIGYKADSLSGTPYISPDNICWGQRGNRNKIYNISVSNVDDNIEYHEITFYGGTDVTNPRLIDWLLENGRLTSHQYVTPPSITTTQDKEG